MKISEWEWHRENAHPGIRKFSSAKKLPKNASFVSSWEPFLFLTSFSCLLRADVGHTHWDKKPGHSTTRRPLLNLEVDLETHSFFWVRPVPCRSGATRGLTEELPLKALSKFGFLFRPPSPRRSERTPIKASYELYSGFPHFFAIPVKKQRNLVHGWSERMKDFGSVSLLHVWGCFHLAGRFDMGECGYMAYSKSGDNSC